MTLERPHRQHRQKPFDDRLFRRRYEYLRSRGEATRERETRYETTVRDARQRARNKKSGLFSFFRLEKWYREGILEKLRWNGIVVLYWRMYLHAELRAEGNGIRIFQFFQRDERRIDRFAVVNTLNVICVHFYLLRLVKVVFSSENRYFNLLFLSHRQCVNCMILNIFHINRFFYIRNKYYEERRFLLSLDKSSPFNLAIHRFPDSKVVEINNEKAWRGGSKSASLIPSPETSN